MIKARRREITPAAEGPPEATPARRNGGTRYVYLRRTRCPICGQADLSTTKSRTDGDGTTTRWTRCRRCQHRFIVVVEG